MLHNFSNTIVIQLLAYRSMAGWSMTMTIIKVVADANTIDATRLYTHHTFCSKCKVYLCNLRFKDYHDDKWKMVLINYFTSDVIHWHYIEDKWLKNILLVLNNNIETLSNITNELSSLNDKRIFAVTHFWLISFQTFVLFELSDIIFIIMHSSSAFILRRYTTTKYFFKFMIFELLIQHSTPNYIYMEWFEGRTRLK